MAETISKQDGARTGGKLAFAKKVWGTQKDQLSWSAIRVLVGLLWLNSFWGKFTNPAYVSGFAATNKGFAAKTSFGFYRDFLNGVVIPNSQMWANLTMFGELTVGVLLVLGLLTNIGAITAFFLNVNFWLAAGQTGSTFSVNILMAGLAVAFIATPGAKYLSLDRFVAERVLRKLAVAHPRLTQAMLQRKLGA
jgi:thiosulfate dehydrogenase [quinone] large subunit